MASGFGEGDQALAGIERRRLALDPGACLETPQDAAEVAHVQPQPERQRGSRERRPRVERMMGELIEHPHFGQGQVTAQIRRQHTNALRVNAVELAQRRDMFDRGKGLTGDHGWHYRTIT